MQHVGGEVDGSVPGGLRPDERAAPGNSFSRQDSGELVDDAAVLSEEESDLAASDADVARGNVGVGPDVAEELGHEALAEAHDFVIALALGIEIRSALAAAHGKRGQRVLENLLEGKELQDAEIHRRVETEAALVGSDGAVHLDAEAAVDPDLALIVHPGNAEHDDPLGLDDSLQDLRRAVLGMTVEHQHQGLRDFRTAWWNSGSTGFFAFTSDIRDWT